MNKVYVNFPPLYFKWFLVLKGAFVTFPFPTAPLFSLDNELGAVAVFLTAELHESPYRGLCHRKGQALVHCVALRADVWFLVLLTRLQPYLFSVITQPVYLFTQRGHTSIPSPLVHGGNRCPPVHLWLVPFCWVEAHESIKPSHGIGKLLRMVMLTWWCCECVGATHCHVFFSGSNHLTLLK